MDTELLKEWLDLREEAVERIRKGSNTDAVGVARLFQIVVLESFDNSTGWEIYRKISPTNAKSYFAVRTCWQRDRDATKFETPIERLKHHSTLMPTLVTRQIELPDEEVESIINKLKAVSIPVFIEIETIGTDGTSYEFSFDEYFVSGIYRWWETPPAPWKPLSEVILTILRYLEGFTVKEVQR
jgi:hypothetical protein